MKKMTTMLAGVLAVVGFVGAAQAETRLAVQDATGTVDKMTVTDLGRIGVGISNPVGGVQIVGSDLATAQIITQYAGPASAAAGGAFVLLHNNVQAFPAALDRLGYFAFGSYDYTNPASPVQRYGASLTARAAGPWSSTSWPTNLSFETADVSGGRVERMRILGTGNIGIGATGPTQKLEVNGGIRLNPAATPAQPTCDSTIRGTLWYVKSGAGVADILQLCMKKADGTFAWSAVSIP